MAYSVNTFNFIPNSQRIMYETAFNSITHLELWNFMRDFQGESFMFSNRREVERIYEKIENLGYYGHSGSSFGMILREMQYIAKYGLDEYENLYRKNNNLLNENLLPQP